jgi:hypothetical protein
MSDSDNKHDQQLNHPYDMQKRKASTPASSDESKIRQVNSPSLIETDKHPKHQAARSASSDESQIHPVPPPLTETDKHPFHKAAPSASSGQSQSHPAKKPLPLTDINRYPTQPRQVTPKAQRLIKSPVRPIPKRSDRWWVLILGVVVGMMMGGGAIYLILAGASTPVATIAEQLAPSATEIVPTVLSQAVMPLSHRR